MDTFTEAFADVPEGLAAMAIMSSDGDTKYTWDPKNPDEVDAAREHFDLMRKKGFLVFKIKGCLRKRRGDEVTWFNPRSKGYMYVAPEKPETATETEGVVATEFDPEADRYVATPAVCGG